MRDEGKSADKIADKIIEDTGMSPGTYRRLVAKLLDSQTIRDARWRKPKK